MGYQLMFYGGLALSIVSLILAIYFFIKYQIKQVIVDLTGFKFSKPKQKADYNYQADLTTSGKRTTSNILVKKNQAIQTSENSFKETELLVEEKQSEVKETELLTDVDDTALLSESKQDFVIDEDMIVADSNEVIENGGKKIV